MVSIFKKLKLKSYIAFGVGALATVVNVLLVINFPVPSVALMFLFCFITIAGMFFIERSWLLVIYILFALPSIFYVLLMTFLILIVYVL